MHELEELGWGAVRGLSSCFRELELQAADAHGRTHALTVALPYDYPRSPPK
jgi:hypothetical protein